VSQMIDELKPRKEMACIMQQS